MELTLLDLPTEMLEFIATFLPVDSLVQLRETCRTLNSIASIDSLWQLFCWREFKIAKKDGWDLTYKDIYTKILLPLPVFGLRRIALSPLGGLIHTSWGKGEINVNRLKAGETTKDPLISEPLFNLQWNAAVEDLEVRCVQSENGSAPATIAQAGKSVVFQCCNKDCYKSHKNTAVFLGQSHQSFPKGFEDHWSAFDKLDFQEGFNCPLLPLRQSSENACCPVKPGLYKGSYGSHGIEILQAGINEEQPQWLECLKLTGDPNVPAGNVSIKVSLDHPMILSHEEQDSVSQLMELDNDRSDEAYERLRQSNNGNPDLRQPFEVPSSCSERNSEGIPKYCLARYTGLGRIAGHFFSSPSFCKLHFIKFDEDTFGILWLDLYCFSVFHREKQDFPISTFDSGVREEVLKLNEVDIMKRFQRL